MQKITRLWFKEFPDYLTITYAYLPLTLGANVAYYLPAATTESGKILPVLARTFGFNNTQLPTLTWSLDVATFLQGGALWVGLGFSLYVLFGMTKTSWLSHSLHLLAMLGLTGMFLALMVI